MARLPRIAPTGVSVHIIQRGNNRQACFGSSDDHAAYVDWLKEYTNKYEVDLHAWVCDDQPCSFTVYATTGRFRKPHDASVGPTICAIFQFSVSTKRNAMGGPLQILLSSSRAISA